jgi:uncharacterized protein (TIGR03083 family)
MAESLGPILVAHLYAKVEEQLIDLLRSLGADEWERETIVPGWKVREIAAHLLDTQLRRLSLARDGYLHEPPTINSPADLVAFINRLNGEGVSLYRRLSAPVLISLMEVASRECAAHFGSLDPFAPARFAVSWAGDAESRNWFDTARELTERWHHQQQIRLAIDRPGIMTRELYFPVLDAFMRALPFHYREVARAPGRMAQFDIVGDCGGSWHLLREADRWTLTAAPAGERISLTTIPQEIAWRIFTKGIDREAAQSQVDCQGDREAGLHVLRMLAIVG